MWMFSGGWCKIICDCNHLKVTVKIYRSIPYDPWCWADKSAFTPPQYCPGGSSWAHVPVGGPFGGSRRWGSSALLQPRSPLVPPSAAAEGREEAWCWQPAAGSSFRHAASRERAAVSLRCTVLCDPPWPKGDYCSWVWHRPPPPRLGHNEIICCAIILGFLPERLIPLYFLHLPLTEAAFLTKFTGISQLSCYFILFVI